MNSKTKNQLVAAVIVALIAVFVAWYVLTRQVHYQLMTLTQIDYTPSTAPYLTYTFSQPIAANQLAGNAAILKSFVVAAGSPTPPAGANALIGLLTKGPPFVPNPQSAPNVLTSNTLPAGAPPTPMSITGNGIMWIFVPKKK